MEEELWFAALDYFVGEGSGSLFVVCLVDSGGVAGCWVVEILVFRERD